MILILLSFNESLMHHHHHEMIKLWSWELGTNTYTCRVAQWGQNNYELSHIKIINWSRIPDWHCLACPWRVSGRSALVIFQLIHLYHEAWCLFWNMIKTWFMPITNVRCYPLPQWGCIWSHNCSLEKLLVIEKCTDFYFYLR